MRESPNGRKRVASLLPGTDIDGTRRQPSLGTILVVDDDRDTADITAALLQSMGLAVMAVYSARDGLDRLDESPDICLVLSDVRMPGVDGFDFIRVVKHRFPSLPALLTTGLPITDEDVIPRGVLILQKPYAIDELRGAIAEQLQIPLNERPASL
jgi:two-component system NtrC family sensor kinase